MALRWLTSADVWGLLVNLFKGAVRITLAAPYMITSVPDNYREVMRQRVEDADSEAKLRLTVTIEVSRREVLDLMEAVNQLNQMNPWHKGVARRLRELAVRIGNALDRAEDTKRGP